CRLTEFRVAGKDLIAIPEPAIVEGALDHQLPKRARAQGNESVADGDLPDADVWNCRPGVEGAAWSTCRHAAHRVRTHRGRECGGYRSLDQRQQVLVVDDPMACRLVVVEGK